MIGYSVLFGDCAETMRDLADNSVHCIVTSPPYFGLRSYLRDDGQDWHLVTDTVRVTITET